MSSVGHEAAQAPLTERELEQVKRLFSDPFAIPLEFKQWIVSYLETNPPLLTTSSIFGFEGVLREFLAATGGGAQIGAMTAYAGTTDPNAHWLVCDGRLLSRTTYAKLFGVISTAYGVGDGSTTFGIPDTRGRALVGKGTHVDVDTLGDNDGAALVDRRPAHRHTVTDPGHTHDTRIYPDNAATGGEIQNTSSTNSPNFLKTSGSTTTGVSVGPSGAPLDTPSFVVVNHIIYVG